jgi:hypothetical protein
MAYLVIVVDSPNDSVTELSNRLQFPTKVHESIDACSQYLEKIDSGNKPAIVQVTCTAVPPQSGSNISISTSNSLHVGYPYVITSVGSTTQLQWQAVGLNASLTAAPGVAFIAYAPINQFTQGVGSGVVQALGVAAPSDSGSSQDTYSHI